jgi:8-oxo-dGTP diphosphatase
MCAEAVKTVVAALVFNSGKLLICQRAANGRFPNKWEFPGGKVEAGEEPKEALRRELAEELGISTEIGDEVWRTDHQYPGHPALRLLFFSVRSYSPSPENRVFEQILWMKTTDLSQYDFLEADRPLVERLSSGELTLP